MIITKDVLLKTILNFSITSAKISLIRDYCFTKGKSEEMVNLFILKLMSYPSNIVDQLSRYIIEKEIEEKNYAVVLDKKERIIYIY